MVLGMEYVSSKAARRMKGRSLGFSLSDATASPAVMAKFKKTKGNAEFLVVKIHLAPDAEQKHGVFANGLLEFGNPIRLRRTLISKGEKVITGKSIHLDHDVFQEIGLRNAEVQAKSITNVEAENKDAVAVEEVWEVPGSAGAGITVCVLERNSTTWPPADWTEALDNAFAYCNKNTKPEGRAMFPTLQRFDVAAGTPEATLVMFTTPLQALSYRYYKNGATSGKLWVFTLPTEALASGKTGTGADLGHVQNDSTFLGAYWTLSGPKAKVGSFLAQCRAVVEDHELIVVGNDFRTKEAVIKEAENARKKRWNDDIEKDIESLKKLKQESSLP
ncbi:unnamed protein product [Symbiodinium sp. CCMP2456]|nr:unnamed protein product [Symbiodinium sp. CCMP2456]